MALINSIAEIRAVIPRLSNLSDPANLPNVDKAGRMHILPIIGKELYEHIDSRYNAQDPDPELTEDEQALIKCIQLPLAAFTLLDDLPFLQTTITDNGIRTAKSDKLEPAHRWEFKELQNALASYAADGLELLLQYLYEHKADLALWTGSDAFKELDGYLIKTGTDFRRYYPLLQPLRTFWQLKPVFFDVEENYLSATLGRDLLAWVKIQDEIIVTGDGGEVDVLKLLKKATAHLSIKHAGDQLAVQFSHAGFTVLSAGSPDDPVTDGRAQADRLALDRKLEAANREGQNYLSKSAYYLVGIANGLYGDDWGEDFTTAFDKSPLKKDPKALPQTTGNERRKIFRF